MNPELSYYLGLASMALTALALPVHMWARSGEPAKWSRWSGSLAAIALICAGLAVYCSEWPLAAAAATAFLAMFGGLGCGVVLAFFCLLAGIPGRFR